MEPERKIEKLLRAYAEKRRAEAGDPLKLHPATRRMLQDEVSRQTSKPESDETSVSLWQLFRQQWAFLLTFALIVFLGGTMILPTLSSAKHKAQSLGAINNLRQIGLAAQMVAGENNGKLPASLDELTNGLVKPQILTDPVSGKPFVYVARGDNLDDLKSNDVLAYSPVDKDGRAVLLADGRVEYASRARFSELTNQNSTELAMADNVTRQQLAKTIVNAPAAAPPPAVPEIAGKLEVQKPSVTASQLFTQTAGAALQNLYRNVSISSQTAPVLQSFQVVQNGNAISVVDRDGSVYQGSVQAAATEERKGAAPVEVPAGASAPLQEAKEVQSVANLQQAVQNYFFRVTGMNRTLKQNVVFSGNMEAPPGTATNTQQTFGGMGGRRGGAKQRASIYRRAAVAVVKYPCSGNGGD
jgi:hypothetical protein